MLSDPRPAAVVRGFGVVTLVGVFGVTAVGLTRPLPDPGLLASHDDSCLQFSQDGGRQWGDVSAITLDESFTPVPGGEYLQADFLARNHCAATASLQVYAGAWQVSAGGSGLWRADLGGATGTPVALTGPSVEDDWGVLISEIAAPTNQSIPVRLYLGIPAAETMQNYSINPAWALSLEQSESATVPDAPSGLQAQPGSPTTEDRVTVTGVAEPGSIVEVSVAGQVRCTTTASVEDGTFSCDVGVLTRGKHQISATATNSVGTSAPSAPVSVTVRTATNGWGSLDDLFGWGSLGGLGSLGSAGAGSVIGSAGGSEAGSSTGSIAEGSLGTLGSATDSSGASAAGSATPGNAGPGASRPGTGGAGAAAPGSPAVGGSAPGAGSGAAAGSGNTSTTGPGHGTAPVSGSAAAPGTAGTGQSGTGGETAAGGGTSGGQSPGTSPGATTGGQAPGAAPGELSADSLGVGSSAPGNSDTRPLGSVEGLIQLGSSTIRAGR